MGKGRERRRRKVREGIKIGKAGIRKGEAQRGMGRMEEKGWEGWGIALRSIVSKLVSFLKVGAYR